MYIICKSFIITIIMPMGKYYKGDEIDEEHQDF